MSENQVGSLGRFVWYEYMAGDVEAAVAFYGRVCGHTAQKWEGGFDYTMLADANGPFAGVSPIAAEQGMEGVPPHWVAYVGTPDADATAAKAQALGGSVVAGPIDVPGVGRMYFLRDPQGVNFAIHQSANAGEAPEYQAVSWHELITPDVGAGLAFYRALFGWNETGAMDMGPLGTYHIYGLGQRPLGGMFTQPAEVPVPHWMYYLHVADIHAAAAAVVAAGGKVVHEIHEVPGGDLIAHCLDPQGAPFGLHYTR